MQTDVVEQKHTQYTLILFLFPSEEGEINVKVSGAQDLPLLCWQGAAESFAGEKQCYAPSAVCF